MNEAFAPTNQDAAHLAHIFSRRPLDYAFKKAKSMGCTLKIASFDGERRDPNDDFIETRINVNVIEGIVTRAWVG